MVNPDTAAPLRPDATRTIRFLRRGEPVSLSNVPPSRTLLEVLREDLGCTGTKEGCGEGDCGACTVVLGEAEPGPDGPHLRFRAINSCIRLAHSIDGMALWTVEDIADDPMIRPLDAGEQPGGLHPAQEAMVQCHGSQCGFCTPGFVMSLFGMYQNHLAPTLVASRTALPPGGAAAPAARQSRFHEIAPTLVASRTALPPGGAAAPAARQSRFRGPGLQEDVGPMTAGYLPITRELAQEALSGNLCRCTGYRPILDAAQAMGALPGRRVDEAAVLEKLQALTPSDPADDQAYMAPRSLDALLRARADHPDAQLVAGCTDVGLWVTKQHRQFSRVLDVTAAAELRRIEDYPHHLAIGAAVTLSDAYAALARDRAQLHTFAARFAGLPVRNSGTLGGNVANGSPIGDSMPLLIALQAHVVLMSVRGHRELPLEQLYTGYRTNVMAPDELLAWIKVPKPPSASASSSRWDKSWGAGPERLRVYKISKRYDDDISAVCLAIRLHVDDKGTVTSASIGAGGVAATPVRAVQTEAAFVGQPWTQATVRAAMATLRAEFSPISDMRASAAYRSEVLGNLLQRYWLESQGLRQINLASFTLEETA